MVRVHSGLPITPIIITYQILPTRRGMDKQQESGR